MSGVAKTEIPIFGGDGNVLFQLAGALSLREAGAAVTIIDFRASEAPTVYQILGWATHETKIANDALHHFIVVKPTISMQIKFLFLYILQVKFEISGNFLGWRVSYFQTATELTCSSIKAVASMIRHHFSPEKYNKNDVFHYRGNDFSSDEKVRQELLIRSLSQKKYFQSAKLISDDKDITKRLNICHLGGGFFDDINYMANSRNIFIGNSTFAFWAAQLGEKKTIHTFPGSLVDRLSDLLVSEVICHDI